MPYRFWLKLAAVVTALAMIVTVLEAWRAGRRDRAQLAAELASTKQLVAAADARQRDRDAQLAHTLAELDAQKRAIVTPAQIVRELPKSLPLPAPIILQSGQGSSVEAHFSASPTRATPQQQATLGSPLPDRDKSAGVALTPPSGEKPALDGAFLPRADLRPLYDFTLDCQACQAKLSAARNDLADEKAKTAALTKERDDALRIAKGGSPWRRVTRAAKWFLLGAAAGAIAAKAH